MLKTFVAGTQLGGPFHDAEVLHQFHHVFWVGALNYRIDFGKHGAEPEFKNTKALIAAGDFCATAKAQRIGCLLSATLLVSLLALTKALESIVFRSRPLIAW